MQGNLQLRNLGSVILTECNEEKDPEPFTRFVNGVFRSSARVITTSGAGSFSSLDSVRMTRRVALARESVTLPPPVLAFASFVVTPASSPW